MSNYKTITSACPEISPELSALIAPLLTGAETRFSYAWPIDALDLDRCIFCETAIANFKLANGEIFGAEVETDERGVTRAELSRPHRCPESIRFEQFLLSPDDEPEQADGE